MLRVLLFFGYWLVPYINLAQQSELEAKVLYQNIKRSIKSKNIVQAESQISQLKKSIYWGQFQPQAAYIDAWINTKQKNWQEAETQIFALSTNYGNHQIYPKIAHLKAQLIWQKSQSIINVMMLLAAEKNEALSVEVAQTYKNAFLNAPEEQQNEVIAQLSTRKLLQQTVYNWLNNNELNQLFKSIPDRTSNYNTTKKQTEIAVLLPFGKEINSNNQYIFDLLVGIKMGVEQLKDPNIKLNYYEVNNELNATKKLIANKSFQQNDLIIGPLHLESNRLLSLYAEKNKIVLVNPLAHEMPINKDFKSIFLNRSSYSTLAYNFAEKHGSTLLGQALIVHDRLQSDSTLAMAYASYFVKNKIPYKILDISKLTVFQNLAKEKAGHVFLAIDPIKNRTIFKQVSTKLKHIPQLSVRPKSDDLSLYFDESAEVYLANWQKMADTDDRIMQFKTKYWQNFGSLASEYSMIGYDLAIFWAKNLKKYGYQNLPLLIHGKSYDDDYIIHGFDYSLDSKENRSLFITTFIKGTETNFNNY